IIFDIEWDPSGQYVAIADTSGARIVDRATNQEVLDLAVQATPAWEVAWSPDGTKVAVSENDGTINIWDVSQGLLLGSLVGHQSRAASLAWNSSGTNIVSSTGTQIELSVRLWDTNQYSLENVRENFTVPADVAWGNNDSQIYVASTLDGVVRIDASTLGFGSLEV